MTDIRRVQPHEAATAADIHRRASALIPGYDTSLHTWPEYISFYQDTVLMQGPVWGVYDGDSLRGHIALRGDWVDHLYVDPAIHSQGLGSLLVGHAKSMHRQLWLYTFQANVRARAFYERHRFVIDELTDGARNEENMPDVTYHWVSEAAV